MRALVCSPDYIDIQEEINVHMKKSKKPNVKKARPQWQEQIAALMSLGAENVEMWFLDPVPGLQDMCFTANGGWCRWGKVILSNLAYPIRRAEQLYYEHWFNVHRAKMLEVEIHKLPPNIYFEGQGDVVTIDSVDPPIVLMGYGQGRTQYEAARYLAEIHGLPEENVIPMRLVMPELYHKDMAGNFISPRRLYIFYPQAFDSAAKRIIWSALPSELYAVSDEDARRFTPNGIFAERKRAGKPSDVIYIASNPTDEFIKDMEARGIEVWRRDVSEFHKSGGSSRCLILFLPEEKSIRQLSDRV